MPKHGRRTFSSGSCVSSEEAMPPIAGWYTVAELVPHAVGASALPCDVCVQAEYARRSRVIAGEPPCDNAEAWRQPHFHNSFNETRVSHISPALRGRTAGTVTRGWKPPGRASRTMTCPRLPLTWISVLFGRRHCTAHTKTPRAAQAVCHGGQPGGK